MVFLTLVDLLCQLPLLFVGLCLYVCYCVCFCRAVRRLCPSLYLFVLVAILSFLLSFVFFLIVPFLCLFGYWSLLDPRGELFTSR